MSDFAHLHTHSYYSLLDGLSSPGKLVKTAKENGQTALALTDHGALHGLVDFYKEAKKEGIHPVLGVETYVAPGSRFDKTVKFDYAHLILLAKNEKGYQNLLAMITKAHLEGYYYKPRVDRELLEQYGEGLIATSACLGGEVLRALANDDEEKATEVIRWYQQLLGPENYYIELQAHPTMPDAQAQYPKLVALAKKLGVPVVGTADLHYAKKEDHDAHDVLLCVQMGKEVSMPDRMKFDGRFDLAPSDNMLERFTVVYGEEIAKEACANTMKIANDCQVEIPLGGMKFPKFVPPDEKTPDDYLREVSYQGLEKRYGIPVVEIQARLVNREGEAHSPEQAEKYVKIDRLLYELDVIIKMGFSTYMLVVWDYIAWAKAQNIAVGPGRGSAAGSIVAYCVGITNLDPLKYALLFERFLNPDRIEEPDIDTDFSDTRRDEVIQYVIDKYGRDKVANICTFGTMKARAVVRDVGRTLGFTFVEVDMIAKLISARPGTFLKDELENSHELQQLYKSDVRSGQLLDYALQLEGCVRHVSTHACAVVVSPEPLVQFTPVQYAPGHDDIIITQYSAKPIQAMGLMKMDFLGLRNLTILERALELIKKVHGEEIDLDHIPMDDPKTFKLFGDARMVGVFQYESEGMRKYLRELQPSNFEDLIALAALYRPGPIQAGYIDQFMNRKHGREKVTYQHPAMETALKNTYGVVVYQEQVMQISRDLCGFSGPQADTLRKAMGKKIPEMMAKMRKEFVDGAVANKVSAEFADSLFSQLEVFAGYAFNKSHSACYALIAYQTAYLKANYTKAYMAALLSVDEGNMDRVTVDLKEAGELGLKILPPHVNESFKDFTVVEEGIRFGLKAIKGIGDGPIEGIVKARKEGGPFTSLDEFLTRVDANCINKRVLESLAMAGAFEGLAERKAVMDAVDQLTQYAREVQGKNTGGQVDLFSLLGEEHKQHVPRFVLPNSPPANERERLLWEKEVLGMFVSEHPLLSIQPFCEKKGWTVAQIAQSDEGKQKKLVGIISQIKKIQTKNGDAMLFVTFEDLTGNVELIVFPRALQKFGPLLTPDVPLTIEGKISFKDSRGNKSEQPKMLLDSVELVSKDDLLNKMAKDKDKEERLAAKAGPAPVAAPVRERVEEREFVIPSSLPPERLNELKRLLMSHRGDTRCVIHIKNGDETVKKVLLPFCIDDNATLQVGVEVLCRGGLT